MKAFMCCAFLLSIAVSSAFGQDVPTVDPIRGVWKLSLDKSKKAAPALKSEVITIASQSGSYKLTFDIKQTNGYNRQFDIMTNMKGGPVKPVNADGKPTNDVWRITRQGAKAFDMKLKNRFGEWTDKYELSSDLKTMTLHHVPSTNNMVIEGPGGAIPSHEAQSDLVFDRLE